MTTATMTETRSWAIRRKPTAFGVRFLAVAKGDGRETIVCGFGDGPMEFVSEAAARFYIRRNFANGTSFPAPAVAESPRFVAWETRFPESE